MVKVALNTTHLTLTTLQLRVVLVVVDLGEIQQVNIPVPAELPVKEIKVEITSVTVALAQVVVVQGLRVEIQRELLQEQVVQESIQ